MYKFKQKFSKEEINQVKLNFIDKEKWLKVRKKKKDQICRNCLKTYEELGSDITLMSLHGKLNVHICETCGKEYIKIGAIDINAQVSLHEERKKQLAPYWDFVPSKNKEDSFAKLTEDEWKERFNWCVSEKEKYDQKQKKLTEAKNSELELFKKETDINKIVKIVNNEFVESNLYNFYEDFENIEEGSILDEFCKNLSLEKSENNTDSHRWYIMHEDIYKYIGPINGFIYYLGVWHVGEHKSEMQCDSDVCNTPSFRVVERFTTVGYR